LHQHVLPEYTPKKPRQSAEKYPRGIHMGSTKEEILQALEGTQNVILNYTTTRGYGHSACLKIHNQQWYMLDSENQGPINLDTAPSEEGWEKVSGHTYILSETRPTDQQLDRFNPYGTNYTNPFQTGTVPDSPPPTHQGGDSTRKPN
jgi:hypothetical protein